MTKAISRINQGRLELDGKPFTVLGAETHNSSSSTPAAIDRAFNLVAELGANTVLAPVAWNQFEPEPGTFDFTLIDQMIATATADGLKLIPLWFGTWKNGSSSYVPAWMKRDLERFPRVEIRFGAVEVVTPFSDEALEADIAAFTALTRHIAEVDTHGTVIMVQVQNEVGILSDARDRSAAAEAAWQQPVPAVLIDVLSASPDLTIHAEWVANGERRDGSWSEVLGDSAAAEEAFMAWSYARYVEQVAAAGRKQIDVPLFANAWLNADEERTFDENGAEIAIAGGREPGEYPSGGPVTRVLEIWQAGAPTLDFFAPDIYFGDFDRICTGFRRNGNALFIPEMRRGIEGVAQMFAALGEHAAIGVAPFGVDSIEDIASEAPELADAYRVLRTTTAALADVSHPISHGFIVDETTPEAQLTFEDLTISISLKDPWSTQVPTGVTGYGWIARIAPERFLVAGRSFSATFASTAGTKVGIISAGELAVQDGRIETVLLRNGDETGGGSAIRLPAAVVVPLESPIVPPFDRSTGVIELELYRY